LTQQIPLYANYGYYSKFDMLNLSKIDNHAIENFVTRFLLFEVTMKFYSQETKDCYKVATNKLRKKSCVL